MNKKFIPFFVLVSVLLTGCVLIPEREEISDPPFQHHNTDGPYNFIERLDPESGDGYELIDGENVPFTKRELDQSTGGDPLQSIGESKILVVPVNIKNAARAWNQASLDKVNKAFFGDAIETSWQSVSSYYETASYGKLKIKGEVAPVFNSQIPISTLVSHIENFEKRPDIPIVKEWIKDETYFDLRKEYDVDENNCVDAVAFIYNVPVDSNNGFWAWSTFEDIKNTSAPTVKNYLWASINFLDDNINANYGINGIDSHVFIHEVGHLLGLDDYYSYDKGVVDVSGSLEMHSANIGDENIYSKFLMGWANPYYVKTSNQVNLNLRSSALYGDAIIINDSWNKTPYDEYIILEFYTPQLNNYVDAKETYKSGYKMYSVPGIRIYHVDSRIVEANAFGYSFATPTKLDLSYGEFAIGPSNSPSRAYLNDDLASKFKLLTLIDAANRKYYNAGSGYGQTFGVADNNSLFKSGNVFTANSTFFINNTKFNAGNEVGYSIRINSISNEYANITITKI